MLQFEHSRKRKQGLKESGFNLSLIKRWSRRNGVFELTPRKTRSWENSAELNNIETKTGWQYVKKQFIHKQFIGTKFATYARLLSVHLYYNILSTLLISHISFCMNGSAT